LDAGNIHRGLSSGCGCICSLDMRKMSTFKRLVLIFFHVTGGHLIKHIFSSDVRGRRGCFGMLTFSHDTPVERQVSKGGNTHFTCFFLVIHSQGKKKPQNWSMLNSW